MTPSPLARALMAAVRGYRLTLSPWLGASCRFYPSCSAYSLEALSRHGAVAGSYFTVSRLLRCHPLCAGGIDPVPDNPPALLRRRPASSSPSPTSSHD